MPTPAPVLPIGADAGVDAASGSSSDDKDGMSGGAVFGVVLGVQLALALLGAVIMWAQGKSMRTLIPTVPSLPFDRVRMSMHKNESYEGGADHAARRRTDSTV